MLATLNLHWLHSLPQWEFCLIVVAAFVGVAVGGQICTRSLLRRWFRGKDYNDTVGHYLSAFGVLYGITLGLISVGAWENYGEVNRKGVRALHATFLPNSSFGWLIVGRIRQRL